MKSIHNAVDELQRTVSLSAQSDFWRVVRDWLVENRITMLRYLRGVPEEGVPAPVPQREYALCLTLTGEKLPSLDQVAAALAHSTAAEALAEATGCEVHLNIDEIEGN